jgi:DNA repair protein RecO (recombination protein O)
MKITDSAYVLHRRPFKDTSLLVDFFTQNHGIMTAVCRGVRQSKKKMPLSPFNPFWIEYNSKHHLATLYQYEPELKSDSPTINLMGSQLYCGLYLNELLVKLLGHHDPYVALFLIYQKTLNDLQKAKNTLNMEKALRHFELYLLSEIGYGISFERTSNTQESIIESKLYYYNPSVGFSITATNNHANNASFIFPGKSLIALAQNDFTEIETLKDAKRLMRLTFDVLLERYGKLKSRELFLKT